MSSRINLKHSFSTSQYIQKPAEIGFPETITFRAQWIIGRSQCLYRVFDMSDVARVNRLASLDIIIKRWAPFSDAGRYIVWDKLVACVWVWDASLVTERASEAGVQPLVVLPESVFYPKSSARGVCWLSSVDGGVIFQLWNDGILLAEKWFKEKPGPGELGRLMRCLELPLQLKLDLVDLFSLCEADSPVIVLNLSKTAWGTSSTIVSSLRGISWEPLLVGLASMALVLMIMWQAVTGVLYHQAIGDVQQRLSQVSPAVDSVLLAQSRATDLNNDAVALLELLDFPYQRELMAAVGGAAASFNLHFKEWHFNMDQLEIIVEGEELKPLAVLTAIEALPQFDTATIDATRKDNQHKLTLSVKGMNSER